MGLLNFATESHKVVALIDLPWGDLKVAYAIDDDERLGRWWGSTAKNKRKLPPGWELCEINGECARWVAVFRVAGIPTIADGQAVQRFLDAIRACDPLGILAAEAASRPSPTSPVAKDERHGEG